MCLFVQLSSSGNAFAEFESFKGFGEGMADRVIVLLQTYRAKLNQFTRSKHFTFGLPFLIFVIGGSFALKEFAQVRYEFTRVNPFELPVQEFKGTAVDPEKEYDKIMSKIDLENWENKRIPRPWEEQPSS